MAEVGLSRDCTECGAELRKDGSNVIGFGKHVPLDGSIFLMMESLVVAQPVAVGNTIGMPKNASEVTFIPCER